MRYWICNSVMYLTKNFSTDHESSQPPFLKAMGAAEICTVPAQLMTGGCSTVFLLLFVENIRVYPQPCK